MFAELNLFFSLKWGNFVRFLFHSMLGNYILLDQLFRFQLKPMLVLDFLVLLAINILVIKVLIVTTIKNLKFFVVLKWKVFVTFIFCQSIRVGVSNSDIDLLAAEPWELHCLSKDATFPFVQLSALFVAGFVFWVHPI